MAYPQSANVVSSMGSDFKDVFNSGRPDIWHTATENESFPLYQNRGGGVFFEVTDQSLLGGTRNMSGWSNGIFDFDNDGWKDLFAARGNVLDNVALMSSRTYEERNSVFRNLGNGRFRDVSTDAGPDFLQAAPHRGAAFGDIDNDGRVDAVVTVLNGPVKYFTIRHRAGITGFC
ncbi:MAG: VCBS repeat-containing protein [Ignavibacteriota bacterium]